MEKVGKKVGNNLEKIDVMNFWGENGKNEQKKK